MKTYIRPPLFLALILAAFVPLLESGCAKPELDPAGPYKGDMILWTADTTITDVSDLCDQITGLAARNPDAFKASPVLSAALARVQKEKDGVWQSDEILANLFAARDAYKAAGNASTAATLQDKLKLARTFLTELRPVLTQFLK